MSAPRIGITCRLLFTAAWRDVIGRFRSPYAFRGVSVAEHAALTTSLQRLGGDPVTTERHLLRNFRKYASLDGTPGGRTRRGSGSPSPSTTACQRVCSDWTYLTIRRAPLRHPRIVPLMDRDSVVWCVDFEDAHRLLPRRVPGHRCADEGSERLHRRDARRASPRTSRHFDRLAAEPVRALHGAAFARRLGSSISSPSSR